MTQPFSNGWMITTLFLVALLAGSGIQAQENGVIIPLWEENQLVFPKYEYQEKYDTTDIVRIQKVTRPVIEAFLPAKKNRKDIGVLICPGGGYGILAWDWEGVDFAKKLNSYGISAFVLKYRLPFPVNGKTDDTMPMRDAMRAMQIIRQNASQWGLSEDRIGIMGFSAGGHLASSVGVHFGDQNLLDGISEDSISVRPDFMALIYPVISFTDEAITHEGSRKNLLGAGINQQKKEYYSSELQVTENTPPAFLIHAGDDRGVPVQNSLLMYQALQENGIESELHIYPFGGHGFGLALEMDRLSKWSDLLVRWILEQ